MRLLKFHFAPCKVIAGSESETFTNCDDSTCNTCHRLLFLEEEMIKTKARYDSLVREYQELKQTVNEVHKSSIDQLPVEVIAIIFEHYVQKSSIENELRCPELALGAICQKWRRIAWSTQSLWTSLSFTFCSSTTAEKIGIAVEWLTRSAHLPVSISLQYIDELQLALAQPLLQAVNECSNRWSSLDLSLPPSFISAIRDSNGASPVLYSLSVEAEDSSGLHIPNTAPERLSLSDIPLKRLNMQWGKLIDFSASSSYSICECIQVLKCATNLTCCDISPAFRGIADFALDMITSSTLTSLDFTVLVYTEDAAFFFDHVTLPALERLQLDLQYREIPVPSLPNFLQRSSRSFKSLTLNSVATRVSNLDALTLSIPFVSDFHIEFVCWDSADHAVRRSFYQAFEPPLSSSIGTSHHFLPQLKSLSLSGVFDIPDELIACLFSHYNSQGDAISSIYRPLESVTVQCHALDSVKDDLPMPYITKNTLDQIEFLKKKGVQVMVFDHFGCDLVDVSLDSLVLEEEIGQTCPVCMAPM
ncbi:hypothetical protein CVT26_011518 [Gymnopilus dilepis]|uniref:Uncharacterized protein n=1 Tax=Gymnopilus dilepis TaxID=231916 RepID=A0A409W5M4_9AGAR|nr:hypothetical protein CVT26_011518 [Gymnopilus dilepis]